MITVSCYDESMTDDVLAVYNRLACQAPYCYPLTAALFAEAVTDKPAFEPRGFFLARDETGPLGFLHAGLADPENKTGGIFLFIADDRNACTQLLDAGIRHLKEIGTRMCYTACNLSNSNAYYSGVHLGYEVGQWQGFYEVSATFRRRGFDLVRERFVMSRDLTVPEAPEAPEGVQLSVHAEPDTGSFYTNGSIVACREGRQIGHCGFHKLTQVSRHFGKGIAQITLGVKPEFHGQGVSRALVGRAHQELFGMGVRTVILTTNYRLYPAIRFYSKMGYVKQEINLPVFAGYFEESDPS